MGQKAKLKDLLGRKPTAEEVEISKRITKEMAELQKDVEEFVKIEVEKNYLVGNLRELSNLVNNAVNKEIYKTNAYYELIKNRKDLDEKPLNELSKVDNVADVVRIQNMGYVA